jgi:hypothetical protein
MLTKQIMPVSGHNTGSSPSAVGIGLKPGKKFWLVSLIFLSVELFSSTLQAAEFFVSPQGSDLNNGQLTSPLKTLQAAASKLKPGDICWVRAGTYMETFRPTQSGTTAAPILLSAYGDELVTISGADIISGWSVFKGDIYKAPMTWTLGQGNEQIFAEGDMLIEARYPNGTVDPLIPRLTQVSATAAGVITSGDLSQADGFWVGATWHGWINESWTAQGGIIKNSNPSAITLGSMTSPWFVGKGKGYITGSMAALDTVGEWFWKDSSLYLWSPRPGSPANLKVTAKARPWTIDLKGLSYITIKGIQSVAGSIRMDGSNCGWKMFRPSTSVTLRIMEKAMMGVRIRMSEGMGFMWPALTIP